MLNFMNYQLPMRVFGLVRIGEYQRGEVFNKSRARTLAGTPLTLTTTVSLLAALSSRSFLWAFLIPLRIFSSRIIFSGFKDNCLFLNGIPNIRIFYVFHK